MLSQLNLHEKASLIQFFLPFQIYTFNFQNYHSSADCKFFFPFLTHWSRHSLFWHKIHFNDFTRYTRSLACLLRSDIKAFLKLKLRFLWDNLHRNSNCFFSADSNDFLTLTKILRQINQNRTSFLTMKCRFIDPYFDFKSL